MKKGAPVDPQKDGQCIDHQGLGVSRRLKPGAGRFSPTGTRHPASASRSRERNTGHSGPCCGKVVDRWLLRQIDFMAMPGGTGKPIEASCLEYCIFLLLPVFHREKADGRPLVDNSDHAVVVNFDGAHAIDTAGGVSLIWWDTRKETFGIARRITVQYQQVVVICELFGWAHARTGCQNPIAASQSMQESIQITQLNKARRLATGLLVVMAVVFVATRLLQPDYPFLSFVTAFSEAAMVGALADWFAVTALFRAPLGLPIPHTAIIPRNKERIGESLANFLKHNFITQEIIREELRPIDFAGAAAKWLADPANSRVAARQIVAAIPAMLRVVEDEDVAKFMRNRMAAALENVKFAPLLAEILAILVAAGHHHMVFNRMVNVMARAVDENSAYIRWKINEHSPRWLPKAIDDRFYTRLIEAVRSTLDEMRDEDSEWRLRFQNALEEFIGQLRISSEYEARIESVVMKTLDHPLFRDYSDQIWQDVKARILADASSDDSQMVAKLENAIRAFSEALLQDTAVKDKLNQWIRLLATEAIVERREIIADLVARVIRKWDAETVSRKLELHVGKDLQYIRINGTLVGGLVGLILHTISLAL
jgi:uncharacterized membrane-anchored protein YjiN (DUF445 family)